MSFSFLPTVITDAVTDLTPDYLEKRGIRLLMMDFDNTIVPYTTDTPTPEMENWLGMMQNSDIQICVVSNSRKERVKRFCEARQIACITHAMKPFSKGIKECLQHYQLTSDQCALVGDQIYTDVLGARSCGLQAILVRAIQNHNILLKLRHAAEMPFILAAHGRKMD